MKSSQVKFLGQCPVCAEPFRHEGASVVERKESSVTLHLDCHQCGGSLLLSVGSSVPGLLTTIGMPTDLTKNDLARLKRTGRAITADDVLELHAYLEKKK